MTPSEKWGFLALFSICKGAIYDLYIYTDDLVVAVWHNWDSIEWEINIRLIKMQPPGRENGHKH